jgi:coenzyme F420 hydrogenase subunit beta
LGFDFKKHRALFKDSKYNYFIGNYKELLLARSADTGILRTSTSGGVTTSILLHCLQNRLIDGAIIVVDNPKDPVNTKCIIAHNKKEILTRSRSRYHLIPLVEIISKIENEKKLAFVGLPCHIQAVRRLQEIGNKKSKAISLLIGLYCGQNQSIKLTKFMLNNLKINPKDVRKLAYRGPKWSGGFNVKTDDRSLEFSKELCDFTNYMFIPKRCIICYDFTGEFSDISLGDAWSKKPSEYGWNEVIVRSKQGSDIIKEMVKNNAICIEDISLKTILSSHRGNFASKKKGISVRIKKLRLYPEYNEQFLKMNKKERIFQCAFLNFILIMHSKLLRKLFEKIPLTVLGKFFYSVKKILLLILFKKSKT